VSLLQFAVSRTLGKLAQEIRRKRTWLSNFRQGLRGSSQQFPGRFSALSVVTNAVLARSTLAGAAPTAWVLKTHEPDKRRDQTMSRQSRCRSMLLVLYENSRKADQFDFS